MAEYLLSEGLLKQITELIRKDRDSSDATSFTDGNNWGIRRPSMLKTKAVILDEALSGASSFLSEGDGSNDPEEPNATICEYDRDTNTYTQTEERLAVTSHSTESHAVDTPGAAIPIDGHYWFFGDCNAVTSRPTPPWQGQ